MKIFLVIVEYHEVGKTLLEGLHEEILGVVKFHEVGRPLLERLHEEMLGIVELLFSPFIWVINILKLYIFSGLKSTALHI